MAEDEIQDHDWFLERLAFYLEAKTSQEDTARIAAHVPQCEICQRRLSELQAMEKVYVQELTCSDPTSDPEARLMQQLQFEQRGRRYDPLTMEDLASLADFYSEYYPVVSLYLEVSGAAGQGDWLPAKLQRLADETGSSLVEASEARRQAYDVEVKRLRMWLESMYDQTGRGLALFTACEEGLWRAFRLPVPMQDWLVASDRPYLEPLLAVVNEFERILVVLANQERARLFVVSLGEIEEYTEHIGELALQAAQNQEQPVGAQGTLVNAAEAAGQLWKRERCSRLVTGGTPEALFDLGRRLPQDMRTHQAGEVRVPLQTAAEEILEKVSRIV